MKKKDNDYGQKGAYSDWEIKDWARDITRAEELKSNPDKMQYIQKCLDKDFKAMKKAISSIEGLRDKRQELLGDDTDD